MYKVSPVFKVHYWCDEPRKVLPIIGSNITRIMNNFISGPAELRSIDSIQSLTNNQAIEFVERKRSSGFYGFDNKLYGGF